MNLRVLLTVVVLAFASHARADDKKVEKIDPDKLLGKWERKEMQDGGMVLEIKPAGKTQLTVGKDDQVLVFEGTWKISGNKVEMTMKLDKQVEKSTRTVTKLTDTELVTIDEKGKERAFVRVKAK